MLSVFRGARDNARRVTWGLSAGSSVVVALALFGASVAYGQAGQGGAASAPPAADAAAADPAALMGATLRSALLSRCPAQPFDVMLEQIQIATAEADVTVIVQALTVLAEDTTLCQTAGDAVDAALAAATVAQVQGDDATAATGAAAGQNAVTQTGVGAPGGAGGSGYINL
jgi:hypothetical protein